MADRQDSAAAAAAETAWLDAARVLATIAVVLLHVSAAVVTQAQRGSVDWWAGDVYDSAVRWSVPMFVLVSGALLLDPRKTERAFGFYRKRTDRIILPLVFWTGVFTLWHAVVARFHGTGFSWGDELDGILRGKPHYHLWFIYMVVGMYAAVPLVRLAVRRLSRRLLWVVVVLAFVLSAHNEWVDASYNTGDVPFVLWFLPFLGYFVCGHLIATSERSAGRAVPLLVFTGAAGLTAVGYYRPGTADGDYFYGYLSVTVIPMAIALALLLKSVTFGPSAAIRLSALSSLTLGVYLVHPIFLDGLRLYVRPVDLHPWFMAPLLAAAIIGASAAVVAALRALPLLRRTV